MPEPLDAARLKVARAREHLAALKAEAAAYLATKPYTFDSEVFETHWWVKPRVTTPPPPRLGLLIGDCLTNARAALDYVLWGLAQKHFRGGCDPASYEDRRILTFPIRLLDPARHRSHVDHLKRLADRGLPSGALDEIRAVQFDASGSHALPLLSDLVNGDKHRMPTLTIGTIAAAQIAMEDGNRRYLVRGESIKDGVAIKAEPAFLEAVRSGRLKLVDVDAAVAVTLADEMLPRDGVEVCLAVVVDAVEAALPRFSAFL